MEIHSNMYRLCIGSKPEILEKFFQDLKQISSTEYHIFEFLVLTELVYLKPFVNLVNHSN